MKKLVTMPLIATLLLVVALIPVGLTATDGAGDGNEVGATGGGENSYNLDIELGMKGNGNNNGNNGNGNWFRYNEFTGNGGTFDLVSGRDLVVVGAYEVTYADGLFTLSILGDFIAKDAKMSISNEVVGGAQNKGDLTAIGITPEEVIWTSAPGQQAFSFSGKSFTFAADWIDLDAPVYVYLNLTLVKTFEPPALGSITLSLAEVSVKESFTYSSQNTGFTGGNLGTPVGNNGKEYGSYIPVDAILNGATFTYDLLSNGNVPRVVGTYTVSANANGDILIAFNGGLSSVNSLYVIFGNGYDKFTTNSVQGNPWNNTNGLYRFNASSVTTVTIPSGYADTLRGNDQYLFMIGQISRNAQPVVVDISDRYANDVFEFELSNSSGNVVGYFDLTAGDSATIDGLAADTYTITALTQGWEILFDVDAANIAVNGDDVAVSAFASITLDPITI